MVTTTDWINFARRYQAAGSKDFEDILGKIKEDSPTDDLTALVLAAKITMWLENSLTWDTTCTNCARDLDRAYGERAAGHAEGYNDGWIDGYSQAAIDYAP